jgi:hypothetical protein
VNPSETESREWKRFEKGGTGGEWVNGRTTSWTNPGSVSSAERAPPPIEELASSTRTECPARGEGDRGGETVRP